MIFGVIKVEVNQPKPEAGADNTYRDFDSQDITRTESNKRFQHLC